MAATRLIVHVFDLACYQLPQSQSPRTAQQKLFDIKQTCEKSVGSGELIKIEHKAKSEDSQLRQDSSPLGVHSDYDELE